MSTVQTGFEIVAARPKGDRAPEDQQVSQEPMRGLHPSIRRAPSSDQKRDRRQMARQQRTATEIPTSAWQLNIGDMIRGPANTTVKVQRVRNHKTDRNLVLIDTEQGMLEVPRDHQFGRVKGDARQHEMPADQGFGGSNTNSLPGSPNAQAPINAPGGGSVPKCPVCGAGLQQRNAGGNAMLVCPRDGYAQQASGLGAQTDPNVIRTRRAAMDRIATSREVLKAIQDRDPDGGTKEPTQSDYDAHRDWAISTHGPQAWKDYRGSNWDETRNASVKVIVTTADMRGKAGECRLCGGDLKVDSVDHSESTVHAHCADCGAEHQVQNVHHQQTASKKVVQVTGLDNRYASTSSGPSSAIARRAHLVLALPEEN